MHWIRTKTPLDISEFGRKKKELDKVTEELILRINKEQNLGARRLEKIIKFTHGKHIPHNAIHKVLKAHGQAKTTPKQIEAQKAMGPMGARSQLKPCASGLAHQQVQWQRGLRSPR